MDTFLKLSLLTCLAALIALNLGTNVFLHSVAYGQTMDCYGGSPTEECQCCQTTGTWICPLDAPPTP
jgi:hypothetical protein